MRILLTCATVVILLAVAVFISRGTNDKDKAQDSNMLNNSAGYRPAQRSALPDARSVTPADKAEVAKETSPRFHSANIQRRLAQMGTVQQERAKIILSPAEVLALAGEPNGREGEDQTVRESLSKDVWGGHAHLLVQALEQGKGIELTHSQVMDFLSGDHEDWGSNSHRWIADELMTVLREDLSDGAFDDFSSLIANQDLDAAIRGYALQHVGHLADQSINTPESVELMWSLARGNDPDLKSTALLGLYQFAKLHPESLDLSSVVEYSQELVDAASKDVYLDNKTSITAGSIIHSVVR